MKKKRTAQSAFLNVGSRICLALACAVGVSAHAGVITVTNINDSGPGSLRQALADANDGDTITFAVTGTIGLISGELLVDKSITISGPGANSLDINGNYMSRIFHIGSGKTVSISGLEVRHGNPPSPDDYGGGVYNDHATLTLNNCVIRGNAAFTYGGGVYNDHASLTLNNCSVGGNVSDNTGGGIYNDGSSVKGDATLQVSNSKLSNNLAQFNGGGIFSDGSTGYANVQITNSTLSGNSA